MKRIIAVVLFLSLVFAMLLPALADTKNTKAKQNTTELEKVLAAIEKKTLKLGDKGAVIKTIKKKMKQLSYYSRGDEMSNKFNADLENRIKLVQQTNHVGVTGKIDAKFVKLLYSDKCITATGFVMSDENNYRVSDQYQLLGNEQFVAGEDGNIIVIVLDTFSNTFFNELLAEKPDTAKGLEDFTYYKNYDCCFVGTYPSMVLMLTGYEYNNKVSIGQWFSDAWKSDRTKSFFKTMKKLGYESYFYSVAPTNCGLKSEAIGLFKNYVKKSKYSGKVVTQKVTQSFYTALQKSGVTTSPGKRFIIQHLHGLHTPYNVNEKGLPKRGATRIEASAGWITITKAYLEALKKAGVYDNSTIIITADHGTKNLSEIQPLFLIKRAGETHEKMAKTNAPVSHREFQSTILSCAGVGKNDLPSKSIFDYKKNEDRERTVYVNKRSKDFTHKPKYNGIGWGSHNVWVGYTYTGDLQDLVKEAKRRGASKFIEMKFSFN